jgi:lipopolysaccharide transport system ATP-binding protein
MASEVLIDVKNLSKRYCRSFKRSMMYGVRDFLKEITLQSHESTKLRRDEFWALKDVSFQVSRGESVGLIGHNGAGKTTILKLINGLIKPNAGSITVKGSIRALIALGAGFNPVLSGRENIWISSAVHGYTDEEIRKNFDEIVAFSELEEFIDSPVQTYSSGMLARLGFSVAVHTQPEILLVDEVLAVGDLNFAIKCYRKINQFRENGGSIILVSHNPYAIRSNCDRAVWIERGKVQQIGTSEDVCNSYELYVAKKDALGGEQKYVEDNMINIEKFTFPEKIESGEYFPIELIIRTKQPIKKPVIGISITNISGQVLLSNVYESQEDIGAGTHKFWLKFPSLPLTRGIYSINLAIAESNLNNQLAAFINCYKFEVSSEAVDYGAGVFNLEADWGSEPCEK